MGERYGAAARQSSSRCKMFVTLVKPSAAGLRRRYTAADGCPAHSRARTRLTQPRVPDRRGRGGRAAGDPRRAPVPVDRRTERCRQRADAGEPGGVEPVARERYRRSAGSALHGLPARHDPDRTAPGPIGGHAGAIREIPLPGRTGLARERGVSGPSARNLGRADRPA